MKLRLSTGAKAWFLCPTGSGDPAGHPDMSTNPEAAEFRSRLAANDALILQPDLDNGRRVVAERTRVYSDPLARWGREVSESSSRPFAVAAIGGTGRAELTPCSDLDIVFLFEDPVESAPIRGFVEELQEATLHTRAFRDRFGFAFEALPYAFDDIPNLKGKELNAFLDLAPIHDPAGLCGEFRRRIRESYDPFEHFLHVRQLWLRQLERVGATAERIDRFDLKNDGLRVFLAAIWTLGGRGFEHSDAVYGRLRGDDPRDLEAYDFLLRLRGWIHLRRSRRGRATAQGTHEEDLMEFEDFDSFGAWLPEGTASPDRFEFAEEVRARLLAARRRVAAFARGVIESELRPGRRVSPGNPVALGAGGLYHANPETCVTDQDRSRAALSLVLTAQRYDLPIDASELLTTFHRAGDWLEPVPELWGMFKETRGSLAASFDFLSRLPGAEDRLFPGYGRFESSLDERVRTERQTLRGPLEREKMRELETERREGERILAEERHRSAERFADAGYDIRVEVEAARLGANELAAVKLALKTKRLPVTPEDLEARNDPSRSLSDRFSSGFSNIPLDEYYPRAFGGAGFPPEVLELARFLVANRRAFREIADAGLIDATTVGELLERCGNDPARARALYVFTRVDRHAWESPRQRPALFFNIRELYAKASMPEASLFNPDRLLEEVGLSDRESKDILLDFGRDFYEGIYRHYAVRFCPHLLRLADRGDQGRPKAILISAGPSAILGVAARDDRGIAASISGALWKHGVGLSQAHLFSATNFGLAFDFFHLAPPGPDANGAAARGDLPGLVEEAIERRLHRSDEDENALPDAARQVTLTEWRHGLYRLRAESGGEVGALIYLLCCKASRRLHADVHGVTSQADRRGARASVFLRLPEFLALEDAREIVSGWG